MIMSSKTDMTLERSSVSAQQNLPNENALENQAWSGAEMCGVGVAVGIFQNVRGRPEYLPQLGPGLNPLQMLTFSAGKSAQL